MACIYTESDTAPVAEIRIVGRVTDHDMDQIIPKLEAFIERHGTIRIVEVIERFEGFDPSTILDGARFDIKHLRNVSHAAVVSDLPWVGYLTSSIAMIMPLTLRAFPLSDVDAARAWAAAPDDGETA